MPARPKSRKPAQGRLQFLPAGAAHPHALAYRWWDGKLPAVVFFHGWLSDMDASKAHAVRDWARAQGRACLLFDFSGHGRSRGKLPDGTISSWRQEATAMLDFLARPCVLVGSSFGGFMALLAALARPNLVRGLVLVAPAADMTRRIVAHALTDKHRAELARTGRTILISPDGQWRYPISQALLDDGDTYRLLDAEQLAIACPVRILQGQRDDSVPWKIALKLTEKLQAQNVRLTLFKQSEHSLGEPDELAALTAACADLVALAR